MSRSTHSGFTLVEFIVVISIIAILIAFLLPAVHRFRGPAERTRCRDNMRRLIIAVHNYHDVGGSTTDQRVEEAKRLFPTGCQGRGSVAEQRLSWLVAVLPQLEESTLYYRFDFEKGFEGNREPTQTTLRMVQCYEDNNPDKAGPITTYIAMAGVGLDAATRPAAATDNGFLGYDRKTALKMIEDGLSNTIALMETRTNLGPWARGGNSTLRGFEPNATIWGPTPQFGGHRGGTHAALADGSVRSINQGISSKTLAAAITIAGNETLGEDW